MLEKVIQVFKIKELRNKIFFVLGILVVFRLAANIPVPGVNVDQLRQFFDNNQFFGLLNLFSGGGLRNISIVMLGVGPYITASIIMQLLTMIVPRLEQIYKEEGEAGRQKFNMWTRWITRASRRDADFRDGETFQSQGIFSALSGFQLATIIVIATAGTVFLMWLGNSSLKKYRKRRFDHHLCRHRGGTADFAHPAFAVWDPSKLFRTSVFSLLQLR